MESSRRHGPEKSVSPADDEVGKPIWKTPEPEDENGDESGEEFPVPPAQNEQVIHAPGFDPLLQQEWEERERQRREEEAERQRREHPRGVWKM